MAKQFQLSGYRDGIESWAIPDGGRTFAWIGSLKRLLA